MSSTSETGHAKNVANFQTLIAYCKSYGASYNPSRNELKITSLESVLSQAQAALVKVRSTKSHLNTTTNYRREGFGDLKKFSTQVLGALQASGASQLVMEDAKGAVRKLQGRRAAAIKPAAAPQADMPETKEDKHISVSQLSFDNQVEHFSNLVQTVSEQPNYNPNEKPLTIAALQAQMAQLAALNNDVINSYTDWSKSRFGRNQIIYNPTTGLTQVAADVKQYVKSLFGTSSAEYKQMAGLSFKVVP